MIFILLCIVICDVQRFPLKSPSKKKKTHFLKKYVSCRRTNTRAHIVQCLFLCYQPFMFFHLLISHTKHPPSTPSHDCDAFMLWVGKYVVTAYTYIYTESSSACEWERVYINMAKLNTKGGGVALVTGGKNPCESLQGVFHCYDIFTTLPLLRRMRSWAWYYFFLSFLSHFYHKNIIYWEIFMMF